MGNVSSRAEDGAPVLLRDQDRLCVTSLKITTSNNRLLYTILPNSFPVTRYTVKKESDDESVVEFVQDPEPSSSGSPPNFLLRLNNDNDIYFYFTLALRQAAPGPNPQANGISPQTSIDTIINSLTFVFAPTMRELDTLVTREFNADPNLHKNPNVDLVGDYSTAGTPMEQFEWSWKWRAPKTTEDKGGGWRNSCSFVEYDQRAHRLNTLVTFSFWVHNNSFRRPSSPKSPMTLRPDFLAPPRARMPSARSVTSNLSDSDTEVPPVRESSAGFETIPELATPLEPTSTTSTVKVDLNTTALDGDISAADDGPLFRATIKSLESKTGSVRQRMKKVLKKAEAARESQVMCNASVAAFMEALREASSSNANAVQPALDHYFEKIATEILQYETANADNLLKLIIDPLSRIYGNDIKQADAKRKDFEDESRDYYAYVSRYLGQRHDSTKEKKRAESDSKYESKRKTFELKRFDYSSFMQDLHGGRKDQEVLSQLTKYADAQAKGYLATAKKIEALMPQLDALSFEVKEADKQFQLIRSGREEKRRALEKSTKGVVDLDTMAMASAVDKQRIPLQRSDSQSLLSSSAPATSTGGERPLSGVFGASSVVSGETVADLTAESSSTTLVSNSQAIPVPDRFKGVRDLESKEPGSETKRTEYKKEGLLWSLSRPGSHVDPKGLNKQAWHKFWVVLDQGRLSEYVNWKQNMEQHMDPIDLRVASVREARNTDRRFLFEVITPHFTRVYQATSDEDMKNWISAINNALQSAFEGRTPPVEAPSVGKSSGGIAHNLFGKSSSYHGHRSNSSSISPYRNIGRHSTVGDRPPPSPRSRSSEERPARLVQSVRAADAGNAWCADCSSDSRVEWVSINLGVIVCIECSGIHRSLGTHISKIRSLTLDTNTFTQDTVELLLTLGNRVSNMVWEAKLDQSQKPTPNATREQRMVFIMAKYQQKAFVEAMSVTFSQYASADEILLASIKKKEMQNVYYALAVGANANATDRVRATHAVLLALAAADPAAPGSTASTTITAAGAQHEAEGAQARKSFAMAELLLQNGAELPGLPAPIPLSKSAGQYLEAKRQQRLGRLGLNGSGGGGAGAGAGAGGGGGAGGVVVGGSSSSMSFKDARDRLQQKRGSAGQNMAKLARSSGVI